MASKPVGILALQGNFLMHAKTCESLGASVLLVKHPQDLQHIEGLIFPGGESTVMLKHFEQNPLWWPAICQFHAEKKPIFGTCAGLILLAKSVSPTQKSFGFLEVDVHRNAYGRQLDSHLFLTELNLAGRHYQLSLPFIRAPKITALGSEVLILGRVGSEVVLVQQGSVMGASCHPEASTDLVHAYFLSLLSTKKEFL